MELDISLKPKITMAADRAIRFAVGLALLASQLLLGATSWARAGEAAPAAAPGPVPSPVVLPAKLTLEGLNSPDRRMKMLFKKLFENVH